MYDLFDLHNIQQYFNEFAGANHPLVLVRNGKALIYKGSRFGISNYCNPKEKHFETQEINYEDGDMIYLFSDGYRDQFGGDKTKKWG